MDYSKYKKIEFRRKFFKLFGAEISIFDPVSETLIGYIKMKVFSLRGDVRVFTDKSMQTEIVRIGGRQVISLQKVYDIYDSKTGALLIAIKQKSLRSYFVRDHMDIVDSSGQQYGYVQETSSTLALVRRWIAILPYIGDIIELIFAFVPQTFDVMYDPVGATPQLAGNIVHKKNPVVVKMSLDTTNAKVILDPRINIAIVSLLSILDASKNK
jgi:hypothetical protein